MLRDPAYCMSTDVTGIPVFQVQRNRSESFDDPLACGSFLESEVDVQFVPLKRTELRGEIVGPFAMLENIQTYGFSKEQCAKTVEAVYRFPLPGSAAVTAVKVRFGDEEIWTELLPRDQAEDDYEMAMRDGRQAVLVTRETPNVFTIRIAGICPDEDVVVTTSYIEFARRNNAGWSIRVPLTTPPRYTRDDEANSRYAQGQPLCVSRDPGHIFTMDLIIRGAGSVESATHDLLVKPEGRDMRVTLKDKEVIPDRDCVISWTPERMEDRIGLDVKLHEDPESKSTYFLAQIVPPVQRACQSIARREVILLVDHSGSMEGPKWEAADWAVKKFVSELSDSDTFNICLFHSTTRWLFGTPQQATPRLREQACQFVESHKDSGGTELGVALEQALCQKRTVGECSRHILVITDAQVTDEGRIMRLVAQESQKHDRRRISVLCIDSSPNALLAEELARRGGGTVRFLTSDPSRGDITTALEEVLADWLQPVVPDVSLVINRANVQAEGPQVHVLQEGISSRIVLGDLPAEKTIWVAGRIQQLGDDDLMFRLCALGDESLVECVLDSKSVANSCATVKSVFGACRILTIEELLESACEDDQLEDDELDKRLEEMGYDLKKTTSAIYPENRLSNAEERLRELLLAESLAYELPCCETAFVGKRTKAGKTVEGTVSVPNALPYGWSEEFVSKYPLWNVAGPVWNAAGPETLYSCAPTAPPYIRSNYMKYAPCARVFEEPKDLLMEERSAWPEWVTVFEGVPYTGTLFDSSRDAVEISLDEGGLIRGLRVSFVDSKDAIDSMANEMKLHVFVGDLAIARVVVSLKDLIRQGGERPMNILFEPGNIVQIRVSADGGSQVKFSKPIRVELLLEC